MHTSQQASTREVCWRILQVITPRVLRHCSHCGTTRQFACSDTFRVNANQRKIDVWLIYRCVDCDCTWNRTIFTRSTPEEIGPVLYQQFEDTPSTRSAFFRLNEDLLTTIRSGSQQVARLKEFRQPVRIIFGDADPYLNKGVAQAFHELFLTSDLHLVPGARHFVQMDEPEKVAQLILSAPTQESNSI